jgi:imidazolonepropionase
MGELGIIEDGAMLISAGVIVAVGKSNKLARHPWVQKNAEHIVDIDCTGKVITPGFVDSHTHPVFANPRLTDFEKRITGASYLEIAEAGGGIRSSIDGVRKAPLSKLASGTLAAFREMLMHGTTTVEAKSGYGLSYESEIKSLQAIKQASRSWGGTVVPTLLGAHVPPPEHKKNPDKYVTEICERMIPEVARKKLARYVDVFCETGAFTMKQSERIFEVARAHGLEVRAHVCQLTHQELEPMMRFNPVSLDHMDFVSEEDVKSLSRCNTIATLVPAANFFLGLKTYPAARKMIDEGVPVALATDYNPGTSPTLSMPLVMSMACTQMKMTPAEALTAATINGAHALGLAERKGSLETGKDADLAIFEVKDYREIAYWVGSNRCAAVLAGGELTIR